MNFVPPAEKTDVPSETDDLVHSEMMRRCEEARRAYQATFRTMEGVAVADEALRHSAGNWQEVQRFLDDPRYTLEQKELILSTLREKDFVDITCEVLSDALDSALPVKEQFEETVFRDYVLAPRVGNEMLLPVRKAVQELFPEGFESPRAILSWIEQEMELIPHWGIGDLYPSIYGCLKYRQMPAYSIDTMFVSLCRIFGFPARLHPATGKAQWLNDSGWQNIRTDTIDTVNLRLENKSGKALCYAEHFTLGLWNGQTFETLRFDGTTLEETCTLTVPAGFYRLITTTRQIDGTASARMVHFDTSCGCVLVEAPEDQTANRLKQEPLLSVLPDGPIKETLQETTGTNRILVFADPGSEPTEHLLQEFLECKSDFNQQNCSIWVFVRKQEELQNPTLQSVIHRLINVQTKVCNDPNAQELLHRIMGVGDKRLPFVLSVDCQDCGVYARANYNIRMAQTLLLIQKLISGGM